MELIKLDEINIEARKSAGQLIDYDKRVHMAGFECGVAFAESKLNDLMVEMLKFLHENYDSDFNGWRCYGEPMGTFLSHEQLILKFMEDRGK